MSFLRNFIKWLVITLLFLDFLFIMVCNFNIFNTIAVKITENTGIALLKEGDTAIFVSKSSYKEGDIIVVSNLDKYYIQKIKNIDGNIIETISLDEQLNYGQKNIEDVIGVYFIKINLTMVITFITTLSLGILFLIFDFYFKLKKNSENIIS